eukprot:565362-Rhodomonas_salina.3
MWARVMRRIAVQVGPALCARRPPVLEDRRIDREVLNDISILCDNYQHGFFHACWCDPADSGCFNGSSPGRTGITEACHCPPSH